MTYKIPQIFSAYGPKPVDPGIDCSVEPSMTKQSFKDECDINVLMARYGEADLIPFVKQFEPSYGDASAIDFQEAMNVVVSAQDMFDQMPAKLRERFNNSPANFLGFVEDPSNFDEGVKLGLFKAPESSGAASQPSASVAGAGGAVPAPPVGGNAEG